MPPIEARVPGFLTPWLFVVLLVQWRLSRRPITGTVPMRTMGMLLCWVVLGMLPVLFFVNQAARYYAVHAGIPLVVLISIICSESVPAFPRAGRSVVFTLIALIVFVPNWFFVQEKSFSRGIRERIINDGRFHLVKRTAAVDSVYNNLFRRDPDRLQERNHHHHGDSARRDRGKPGRSTVVS